MNAPSERREHLAQRTSGMRDLIARMDDLDEDTTLSSLDPVVRERFSSRRLMPRLVMRRGRRIASKGLFAPAEDRREQAVLDGGAGLIEHLSHAVGAHILWQEVVRLVQRRDTDALNEDLGVASRDIALTARDEAIGVVPLAMEAGQMSLADRAKREGAMSWACWLAARDSVSARRMRVLTSNSVSSLVAGGLPDDPEQRDLRRRVVEFEIDRLVASSDAELREEKVL